MAGFGNDYEDLVLEGIFKGQSVAPADIYVSLHSADPGDTGANEIAATGGYAREQVSPDAGTTAGTWSAVANGSVSNAGQIDMGTASGSAWNSGSAITHFGLWTASTPGTFIAGGQINSGTGVVVLDGTQLVFPANQLTVTLD